jgi:hypothetical protein
LNLPCHHSPTPQAATSTYADLTLTSGIKAKAYQQSWWGGTTIFRSPLVSFAYERGWRQGFAWAGFPGADKEFELAMDYLQVCLPGLACAIVLSEDFSFVLMSACWTSLRLAVPFCLVLPTISCNLPLPLAPDAASIRRDTSRHELRQRPLHPPLPQVKSLQRGGGS